MDLIEILKTAVQSGASDIHLVIGKPPMMRLNGEITEIPGTPRLSADDSRRLVYSVLYEEQRTRFEANWELDCSFAVPNLSRFRLNALVQRNGVEAVMRVISNIIPTPEQLRLPPVVTGFASLPRGLVLVTGPTGSGKSTTLAALLDYININFNRHIITVEEPIEFIHSNKRSIITQREVPIQTPSFADGLRASLREDSDIVLVGEMRDLETISLALTAAETGLLVFGTLHTNNARKTVDRIIDVFPADQQSQVRTMLAASLRGVVAQLLCKRVDKPGRTAVHEIMFATPAVAAIIREGATQKLYDVITSGKSEGMQFMDESIWTKLRAGMISPQEAYMKAIDKTRFKKFLPANLAHLGDASGESPLDH